MKRREAKSKGEKERHKHLNAEFQRYINTVTYFDQKPEMGSQMQLFHHMSSFSYLECCISLGMRIKSLP